MQVTITRIPRHEWSYKGSWWADASYESFPDGGVWLWFCCLGVEMSVVW